MPFEDWRHASYDTCVLLVTMLGLVSAAALLYSNTRRPRTSKQGLTQQQYWMKHFPKSPHARKGCIAIAEHDWPDPLLPESAHQKDVAGLERILARRKCDKYYVFAIGLPSQAEGWRLKHARYTQKSIVDHIDPSHGQSGQQSFADFLDRLIWCEFPADELPPIRICCCDGVYWSLDNHRLYAFHLLLDLVSNIKDNSKLVPHLGSEDRPYYARVWRLGIEIDVHDIICRCTKQLLLFRSVLVNLRDPGIAQEFRNKRQGNGDVPDVRESGRFTDFPNIYMLPGAYLRRRDGTRERYGAVDSWCMYGGYGYGNSYWFNRNPAPL